MAYVRPYRVSETTTTVGTGTLTLAGAETGFSAFSATVANGDIVTYVIEAIDGSGAPSGDWEATDGAWSTGGTLTRGTLRASSTGARVSFAGGTKRVFAIAPYDAVNLANDVTGTLPVANGGTGATTLTANYIIKGNGALPASASVMYENGTNLGINTINPASTLDVSGSIAQNTVAVSALNIDCSTGNYFTKTIAANSIFTFGSVPASRAFAFTLELTHTSGTVTWPATVKWPANTAPTLTTAKTHLFFFVTDDGGTRWRGAALVDYDT